MISVAQIISHEQTRSIHSEKFGFGALYKLVKYTGEAALWKAAQIQRIAV